jgi:hypothetical protein
MTALTPSLPGARAAAGEAPARQEVGGKGQIIS